MGFMIKYHKKIKLLSNFPMPIGTISPIFYVSLGTNNASLRPFCRDFPPVVCLDSFAYILPSVCLHSYINFPC